MNFNRGIVNIDDLLYAVFAAWGVGDDLLLILSPESGRPGRPEGNHLSPGHERNGNLWQVIGGGILRPQHPNERSGKDEKDQSDNAKNSMRGSFHEW
jgi:hypothetical protein